MLDQIVLWLQSVGTLIEFLLLGRMLLLRFQRVYVFVTLYAAINLLIDASALASGVQSAATTRIFFYSRFLFGLIYPLVAWDLFEEAKAQIAKIRRVHLPRMISGVFITLILGLVTSIGIDDQDLQGTSTATDFAGLFLWLGAASTSLLFTWNVTRASQQAGVILPSNTRVWSIFFLITFARAILDCALDVTDGLVPHAAFQVISAVFVSFDLLLACWCLLKLKPVSNDAASAPEKASL